MEVQSDSYDVWGDQDVGVKERTPGAQTAADFRERKVLKAAS